MKLQQVLIDNNYSEHRNPRVILYGHGTRIQSYMQRIRSRSCIDSVVQIEKYLNSWIFTYRNAEKQSMRSSILGRSTHKDHYKI
jgi:hypothetical protein